VLKFSVPDLSIPVFTFPQSSVKRVLNWYKWNPIHSTVVLHCDQSYSSATRIEISVFSLLRSESVSISLEGHCVDAGTADRFSSDQSASIRRSIVAVPGTNAVLGLDKDA
jgi:hypothetical protein